MQVGTDSELKVAEFLLNVKAVQLNLQEPFTWASGWKSPIYCDNRRVLSYPRIRNFIRQELVRTINDRFAVPDIIAGVATGGIPLGVLVAQELGLPFAYVRNEAKGHGMQKRIEGIVEEGNNVVVIEDLISTGKSSLSAVRALKEKGLIVKGLISVFTYNFDVAQKAFEEEKCMHYSLTNYDVLIEKAVDSGYVQKDDLDMLKSWRESPQNWMPS